MTITVFQQDRGYRDWICERSSSRFPHTKWTDIKLRGIDYVIRAAISVKAGDKKLVFTVNPTEWIRKSVRLICPGFYCHFGDSIIDLPRRVY